VLISPPHRTGSQAQYAKATPRPASGPLAPVMEWLDDHIAEPLTLEQAAAQRGVSVEDLLSQDLRVPAMLSELAQYVEVHPAQRKRAAPVALKYVVQPQGGCRES
jgi:hypothetical protein